MIHFTFLRIILCLVKTYFGRNKNYMNFSNFTDTTKPPIQKREIFDNEKILAKKMCPYYFKKKGLIN